MKYIELKAIKESTEDYERVERAIKDLFIKELYGPLIREFESSNKALQNSLGGDLIEAIFRGLITFSRGVFSGRFSASISRSLRKLGAKFDRSTGTFRIQKAELPVPVQQAIAASETRFQEKIDKIDKKLESILPGDLADKINVNRFFDRTIYKTDKAFQETFKGITIAPKLTDHQRKKIAEEWGNNMKLWIEDFAEKEITRLREDMQRSVFAGNRYGAAIKYIQESYGVTENKAKFLARQETGLLMAKFKESRYQDAGVDEYYWYHVAGTANHPVRPIHKALGDAKEADGSKKIYRFSAPPITDAKGNRNNPGCDFGCRCFARAVIRMATSE